MTATVSAEPEDGESWPVIWVGGSKAVPINVQVEMIAAEWSWPDLDHARVAVHGHRVLKDGSASGPLRTLRYIDRVPAELRDIVLEMRTHARLPA